MPTNRSQRTGRRVRERARRREQRRRYERKRLLYRQYVFERHSRRARGAARWLAWQRGARHWAPRIGLAVLAVSAVAAGFYLLRDALEPGPAKLPPLISIRAYRATYRTTLSPRGSRSTRDEVRIVERPFHSLDLSRRNGQLLTGSITNDQGSFEYTPGQGWVLVADGRQPPREDPQPYGAVSWALRRGLARVVGTEHVAGRSCTVVRTGEPIGQTMKKPTSSSYVDLCLDRNGIILDYRWTLNRTRVETMTATSVDDNPAITLQTFVPTPGPLNVTNPQVKSAALTDKERADLTPKITPPSRYTYVAGILQGSTGSDLGGTPSFSSYLLFVDGQGKLIVAGYRPQPLDRTGELIRLTPRYSGFLQLGLDSSTLVVPLGPSTSLSISGPDPSSLISLGRTLH